MKTRRKRPQWCVDQTNHSSFQTSYTYLSVSLQSDWEESSEEESEEEVKPVVAPPKKKGTLKAKLAEKEAEKAQRAADGEVEYDSDDVLDPRAKAIQDKERELNADLNNAADLFGAAGLGGALSLFFIRI